MTLAGAYAPAKNAQVRHAGDAPRRLRGRPTRSAESRRSQRWLSMLRRERSRAPLIGMATIVLIVVLSVTAAAPVFAASMSVNPGHGVPGDPVSAVWDAT